MQAPATLGTELGYKRSAFIGSCKHQIWQAIRASSAAPYYLDDFSDGILFFSLWKFYNLLALKEFLDLVFKSVYPATFIDLHRWQDGAIVANNPTIFSIREAQLLWPDTKIDCLVSVGCGSVPTKVNHKLFFVFEVSFEILVLLSSFELW